MRLMKRTLPSPQWQMLVVLSWVMSLGMAIGIYADGGSPVLLRVLLIVGIPLMVVWASFTAGASWHSERESVREA